MLMGAMLIRTRTMTAKEREATKAIQEEALTNLQSKLADAVDENGKLCPTTVNVHLTGNYSWALERQSAYFYWARKAEGFFNFGNTSYEKFCEELPSCLK